MIGQCTQLDELHLPEEKKISYIAHCVVKYILCMYKKMAYEKPSRNLYANYKIKNG